MYDPTMRVLTVLELLQTYPKVTGAELAARLEVHPRTIQRYVARLQDLGVPVVSTRGTGGAYALKPGFALPPIMFTNEEALALSLGLRALDHLGLNAFAPATQGAAAKLQRVLPRTVETWVRELQAALALDTPPRTVETSAPQIIELASAVRVQRAVRLTYAAHTGSHSERTVDPYGVVHYDGRWYLIGHCHLREEIRSFRIDRIVNIEPSGNGAATFVRPEDFGARAFLERTLPFAPSTWKAELWLGLTLHEAQSKVPYGRALLEAEGQGTRVRCAVDDLDWYAATLLTLGCEVVISHPAELRAAMERVAEKALTMARSGLAG